MGSRAKRARMGRPAPMRQPEVVCGQALRIPIPDLTRLDLVFGEVKHLPPMSDIPGRFRERRDPYAHFVSSWFFGGRTENDMTRLVARPGVDRGKALVAIKAILSSFQPKHEHKEAGAAYLLHEWFELT
jgi:hypothetical protein